MRFWRTQQHLQKPAIPRQGKRRCWYHDRENPEKGTVRLLCGYGYFFRYPMWMRQIRAGGWTDEKGSNYSDGDLPVLSIPVAAEGAQTGTSSVTQQSTINTTVPDTHMVTIRSEHAQVSYQHEGG